MVKLRILIFALLSFWRFETRSEKGFVYVFQTEWQAGGEGCPVSWVSGWDVLLSSWWGKHTICHVFRKHCSRNTCKIILQTLGEDISWHIHNREQFGEIDQTRNVLTLRPNTSISKNNIPIRIIISLQGSMFKNI